jgi:zinc protease
MKMKKLLLAIFTIALGLAPVFAQNAPPVGGKAKPFNLPKSERFTLKNGMQVTLVPYGAVPKVAVTAVVRAGSFNESEDKVWLADLTGQMMKEGTSAKNAARLAEEFSRMGGGLSVGAGADTTNVSTDVLSEFGPEAVALLADVIQRPALPESELARLKNNQLRQLSVAKSQPGPLANERFRQILYPGHPYGRIFPTEAMINGLTIEDVRAFYKNNFGAARTRLYVAGQFDAKAIRAAITQAFDAWARGTEPAMNIPKPTAAKTLNLIDRPNATQSTLYIGLPVVDPSNPDYIPFAVTNALLGGSFSSRITLNIRENKGYTYSPTSQHSIRFRDAYWVEIADVTTAVTGASLKEIFYEIDRLRKEAPPEDEVSGIKNFLAGIFVLQNSSRQGVIGQLAFADLHGLPADYLSTYVQKVMAVTPADVKRIAEQYINPDKMTLVVVGDRSKIAEQLAPFGQIAGN